MSNAFTLVTFNLLNKPSRWHERRHLVVEGLRALNPDVIALQEVSLPHNNAKWIADELGGYDVHTSPKTGSLSEHEAVATLTRLPVKEWRTLDLMHQKRVAQFVKLQVGDRDVALVNGHFMFHVYDHVKRSRQVQRVINYVRLQAGTLPIIACGDFNATPDMRTIQIMKQVFTSAYELKHGREPEYTCPTPLVYSMDTLRKGASRVGNFLLSQKTDPWRDVLDYIFVAGQINVHECDVVLDQPAANDATLYPSDHVGLLARLEIGVPE